MLYRGVDQINPANRNEPMSRLIFDDGVIAVCNGITDLGSDRYACTYAGSAVTATFEIIGVSVVPDATDAGWFSFEIISTTDPGAELPDLRYLEVCRWYTLQAAQRFNTQPDGTWADLADDDDLFLFMGPVDELSVCYIERAAVVPYYQFWAVQDWGLVGQKAAFVTAPKDVYWQTLGELVDAENQPDRTDFNGDWFGSVAPKYQSYILRQLTSANYVETLAAVQRGRFPRMTMLETYREGFYNVPSAGTFATLAAQQLVVAQFAAVGIGMGYHQFWGRIATDDDLFSADNLRKVQFGTLNGGINGIVTTIQINVTDGPNFDDDAEFMFYRSRSNWTDRVVVVIGDEVIRAPVRTVASVATDTFVGCNRGLYGSLGAAHSDGDPVYVAIKRDGKFYADDAAIALAAETFAAASRPSGIELMYVDGNWVPDYNTSGFATAEATHDDWFIIWPFLDAMAKTAGGVRDWERLPEAEYSARGIPGTWRWTNLTASQDGARFKIKSDTRVRKIDRWLSITNAWGFVRFELGWFRADSDGIGGPTEDYDALYWDDVHYSFTKLLAFNTSMGLQTISGFYTHGERDDLLDLMAVYHEMNDRDRAIGVGTIFSQALRTTMQTGTTDGELQDTVGDGIADRWLRKIVDRQYGVWEAGTPYSFNFNQTYTDPTYRLELRARPDFIGFNEVSNTMIADTDEFDDGTVTTSSAAVTVVINAAGDVDITNAGVGVGWVEIALSGAPWDLTGQRGLGFRQTADALNDASIRVRLGTSSSVSPASPRRQFAFTATAGSGQSTVILADTNFEFPTRSRGDHVVLDWSSVSPITVIIYDIPAGESLSLNFDSLKGLEEKVNNSRIVDPIITINGRRIVTSDITLEVVDDAAYLLEFDGTDWGLRDPNRDAMAEPGGSTLTLPDGPIQFLDGVNTGSITSDTSVGTYGLRAELWLHIYDIPNWFPVLGPVGNQSVFVGDTLTITLTATDIGGDVLTFGVIDLPTGATLVDGVFTWTPVLADAGVHTVTFTVTDGELGDYETITITVNIPIREPFGKLISVVGPAGTSMTEVGPSGKSVSTVGPAGKAIVRPTR